MADQVEIRNKGLIILCSALSLVAGGVIGFFTPHPALSEPVVVAMPSGEPALSSTSTPQPFCVHVVGAVQQAGVYDLPAGSIVQDAIAAAGGPVPQANLQAINLAVRLQDQQQVYVPRQGEEILISVASNAGATKALININTATQAELEMLPRIGPTTAQRILDHRNANGSFGSVEAIQDVPGIGPATFEGLKDLITTGP